MQKFSTHLLIHSIVFMFLLPTPFLHATDQDDLEALIEQADPLLDSLEKEEEIFEAREKELLEAAESDKVSTEDLQKQIEKFHTEKEEYDKQQWSTSDLDRWGEERFEEDEEEEEPTPTPKPTPPAPTPPPSPVTPVEPKKPFEPEEPVTPVRPDVRPTPEPTPAPIPEPTPEPTPEPLPTPEPEPMPEPAPSPEKPIKPEEPSPTRQEEERKIEERERREREEKKEAEEKREREETRRREEKEEKERQERQEREREERRIREEREREERRIREEREREERRIREERERREQQQQQQQPVRPFDPYSPYQPSQGQIAPPPGLNIPDISAAQQAAPALPMGLSPEQQKALGVSAEDMAKASEQDQRDEQARREGFPSFAAKEWIETKYGTKGLELWRDAVQKVREQEQREREEAAKRAQQYQRSPYSPYAPITPPPASRYAQPITPRSSSQSILPPYSPPAIKGPSSSNKTKTIIQAPRKPFRLMVMAGSAGGLYTGLGTGSSEQTARGSQTQPDLGSQQLIELKTLLVEDVKRILNLSEGDFIVIEKTYTPEEIIVKLKVDLDAISINTSEKTKQKILDAVIDLAGYFAKDAAGKLALIKFADVEKTKKQVTEQTPEEVEAKLPQDLIDEYHDLLVALKENPYITRKPTTIIEKRLELFRSSKIDFRQELKIIYKPFGGLKKATPEKLRKFLRDAKDLLERAERASDKPSSNDMKKFARRIDSRLEKSFKRFKLQDEADFIIQKTPSQLKTAAENFFEHGNNAGFFNAFSSFGEQFANSELVKATVAGTKKYNNILVKLKSIPILVMVEAIESFHKKSLIGKRSITKEAEDMSEMLLKVAKFISKEKEPASQGTQTTETGASISALELPESIQAAVFDKVNELYEAYKKNPSEELKKNLDESITALLTVPEFKKFDEEREKGTKYKAPDSDLIHSKNFSDYVKNKSTLKSVHNRLTGFDFDATYDQLTKAKTTKEKIELAMRIAENLTTDIDAKKVYNYLYRVTNKKTATSKKPIEREVERTYKVKELDEGRENTTLYYKLLKTLAEKLDDDAAKLDKKGVVLKEGVIQGELRLRPSETSPDPTISGVPFNLMLELSIAKDKKETTEKIKAFDDLTTKIEALHADSQKANMDMYGKTFAIEVRNLKSDLYRFNFADKFQGPTIENYFALVKKVKDFVVKSFDDEGEKFDEKIAYLCSRLTDKDKAVGTKLLKARRSIPNRLFNLHRLLVDNVANTYEPGFTKKLMTASYTVAAKKYYVRNKFESRFSDIRKDMNQLFMNSFPEMETPAQKTARDTLLKTTLPTKPQDQLETFFDTIFALQNLASTTLPKGKTKDKFLLSLEQTALEVLYHSADYIPATGKTRDVKFRVESAQRAFARVKKYLDEGKILKETILSRKLTLKRVLYDTRTTAKLSNLRKHINNQFCKTSFPAKGDTREAAKTVENYFEAVAALRDLKDTAGAFIFDQAYRDGVDYIRANVYYHATDHTCKTGFRTAEIRLKNLTVVAKRFADDIAAKKIDPKNCQSALHSTIKNIKNFRKSINALSTFVEIKGTTLPQIIQTIFNDIIEIRKLITLTKDKEYAESLIVDLCYGATEHYYSKIKKRSTHGRVNNAVIVLTLLKNYLDENKISPAALYAKKKSFGSRIAFLAQDTINGAMSAAAKGTAPNTQWLSNVEKMVELADTIARNAKTGWSSYINNAKKSITSGVVKKYKGYISSAASSSKPSKLKTKSGRQKTFDAGKNVYNRFRTIMQYVPSLSGAILSETNAINTKYGIGTLQFT